MALTIGWTNVEANLRQRYQTRCPPTQGQTADQYLNQWQTWFQALQNQAYQDISQNIAGYIAGGQTHITRTISVSGRFVTPKAAITINCAIGQTATGVYSVNVQSFTWAGY